MAAKDEKTKTLEARVAELEDKLAKVSITEEEMKTYQKVAAVLGPAAAPPAMAAPPPAAAADYYRQNWQHQWQHQWYWNHWYWQHQHRVCFEGGPGGYGGPGPESFGGLGR